MHLCGKKFHWPFIWWNWQSFLKAYVKMFFPIFRVSKYSFLNPGLILYTLWRMIREPKKAAFKKYSLQIDPQRKRYTALRLNTISEGQLIEKNDSVFLFLENTSWSKFNLALKMLLSSWPCCFFMHITIFILYNVASVLLLLKLVHYLCNFF